MKFKLKELDFKQITFNKTPLNNGTVVNLKYNENSLEFQTPKLIIESLIKENEHEYLNLKIKGTEACKFFCSKILELESFFSNSLKNQIKTIFNEDNFIVKIPFKYSKPLVKVYKNDSLFNYYHLTKDLEIICLLELDKLWINNSNEPNYNLIVKEIMVI
uniref:Uncharacterized protein n=1 Tax=viral metagenome TaxID=1070528 RepID=A0A6C0AZ71_9ZZZZ